MSKPPAKRGRPSTYTPEIAASICERMAQGETVVDICAPDEMPAARTVRLWALSDVNGFAADYARARELQAHAIADELLGIVDDGSNDWMKRHGKDGAAGYELNGEHVQRSRLRADTRKWLLARMLPKTYGERVTTELTGADGGPIQLEDATRERIAGQLARLAAPK